MVDFRLGKDSAGPWAKRMVASLRGGEYTRGIVAGLNRTAQAAATTAIRAIQADTGASSQKTIRRSITVSRATQQKPEAKLIARSSGEKMRFSAGSTQVPGRIPLFELKPSPRTVAHRRRSIAGIGYGPSRRVIKSSFIARMKSGHIGIFKRMANRIMIGDVGFVELSRGVSFFNPEKPRIHFAQTITELFGPSVALVFGHRKVAAQIKTTVDERMPIELDRATAHFTRAA